MTDCNHKGILVRLVGPSRAGKDTLLKLAKIELANDERFVFVRRTVTRSARKDEDSEPLSDHAFQQASNVEISLCIGARMASRTGCPWLSTSGWRLDGL
ncbi:hypothetical protein GCM10010869_05720 [Mesorhizobium tianshanense]|uniref:Uncharacterized protein n=1 Tax=Mesorhizobium tianshanense TaxID=39844 RepID=A0A562NLR1_9HYPH|nr:hypothetical protein [Mesorhizobium tianshanense]TWI33145.1 hypothetical protein IQ26_04146 [Mesorhizobium tianshanense]GLS34984.1 hypothetical protein GCM10010869_05720 [Mesorhizobium tianshanense]